MPIRSARDPKPLKTMFSLRLHFNPDSGVSEKSNVRWNPETNLDQLGDVGVILLHLCKDFRESGKIAFQVSGFGEDSWPVDVSTDLATIAEQLPALCKFISSPAEPMTHLDFYEQGVERYLTLNRRESEIEVTCLSTSQWQPNPRTETIHWDLFRSMIYTFYRTFVAAATLISPRLASHTMFQEWIKDIERLMPTSGRTGHK